jgi:ribosomal protein L12E/L44/L45/RPP1/RPP2
MVKKPVVLLILSLFALMLLGSLLVGCGDQNVQTERYKALKSELKAEIKAELLSELQNVQVSAPAPAAAAPAAAAEEEDDEDKFGC